MNKNWHATQAIVDKMLDESVLNNGQRTGYSFGLGVSYLNGVKRVTHVGGHAGYTAILSRYPEEKLSVIILSNRSDGNVSALASRVADIFIPITKNNTSNTTTSNSGYISNKNDFKKYIGQYINKEDLTICNSFVENDTLCISIDEAKPYKLSAIGKAKFIRDVSYGNIIYALFDKADSLYFRLRDRHYSIFEKYTPAPLLTKRLSQFAGTYKNAEINSTIDLYIKDNKLQATLNGKPVESNLFSLTSNLLIKQVAGFSLDFIQKSSKKINGFNLNTSNVKNLYYKRIK